MRRPIMSMQIPRYPNGSYGFQFNQLTLPIVRYRIGQLWRRMKRAEAALLNKAAAAA